MLCIVGGSTRTSAVASLEFSGHFFSSFYVRVCCFLWCISRYLFLAAFYSGVTGIKFIALIPNSGVRNVATLEPVSPTVWIDFSKLSVHSKSYRWRSILLPLAFTHSVYISLRRSISIFVSLVFPQMVGTLSQRLTPDHPNISPF